MSAPMPSTGPEERLSTGYGLPTGVYDEMLVAPGQPRPHWEYLIPALEALGGGDLEARRREASRLLRENGVTYNIHGDPKGLQRPWTLDPIPQPFSSREWATIEAGLIQRADLLELVAADLYGKRRLIRQGLIPPELVFGHPGFLHPCVGVRPAGERYLPFYAVDLGRAPDGSMWVLADRTQVPTGAGYALENRIVLSRILPSLYRDSRVHRLALFFRTLRATLAGLAPRHRDDPRIVLLTPGPGNETYFEHVYLANYLGYTLVQGEDLTVRDAKVWLKTLDGLQPVDVILRRLDDTYCDPLELRGDSLVGVPGLLEAARSGTVAIVNPLGSGVVETPALVPLLPALSRHLLGEELRISSPPTWWCGNKGHRDHVIANLEQLILHALHSHSGWRPLPTVGLDAEQRAALVSRINARPHLFVARAPLPLSTTPALVKGQ